MGTPPTTWPMDLRMNFHWEPLGGETDGGKGRAAESQQTSQRRPRRQPDGMGKEKADADYTLGTYGRVRNTMDEAAGGREQETDENAGGEETPENKRRRGQHKTLTTNTAQKWTFPTIVAKRCFL